jgi:hypothetical protein
MHRAIFRFYSLPPYPTYFKPTVVIGMMVLKTTIMSGGNKGADVPTDKTTIFLHHLLLSGRNKNFVVCRIACNRLYELTRRNKYVYKCSVQK